MKFNVYGFNQEKLVQYYNLLNGNDLIVLRVLSDIIPRMTRKIEENGLIYKQVTYEILLQDIPFVTQSESTLKKIVKKLIDAGLIERKIVNDNGKYTYFRATDALQELQYIPEKKIEPLCEISEELKDDLDYRVEYIERILRTRASKSIKEELKKFKNQNEFFDYYDAYILPNIKENKRHTCGYMLKNLQRYFCGE